MLSKATREATIGIDIGGTKMGAVLFSGGRVVADYALTTPKDDLNKFLIMLSALVEPLFDRAKAKKLKIKGIGIGIPGTLDIQGEKIIRCRNVPALNGLKFSVLKGKIDPELPLRVDNDAKCFTRAEALIGAAKKHQNVLGVIVGTGIGSGWWNGEKIYVGSHGSTGELGTMIVDFISGVGLESAYHKLTQSNPEQLAGEAYKGDILAERAFAEFGNMLGVAFANVINLIDPEIIVVGGGAIKSADLFLPAAKKATREFTRNPAAKDIKIVKSKLGALAGAIGAALLS